MGQFLAQVAVFGMLLWLLAFATNWKDGVSAGAAALAACLMAPLALILLAALGGVLYGLFWLISVAVG
jgi:hypothetical protein